MTAKSVSRKDELKFDLLYREYKMSGRMLIKITIFVISRWLSLRWFFHCHFLSSYVLSEFLIMNKDVLFSKEN